MSLLAQASRCGLRRLVASTARPLGQACSGRSFAAEAAPKPAGGEDADIVIDTFKESQQQYREFMAGLKNIQLPTSDDTTAIRKYASEMEGLKKKLGIPGVDEILDASLEHKLATAQWNVRKFLATAMEGIEVGGGGALAELEKAVDEVEEQTGTALDASNEEGWRMIAIKAKEIAQKYQLDDSAKIREQAITDMYKESLQELRQKAAEEMETAKRRDHLEWVNVDPASIKPKIEV